MRDDGVRAVEMHGDPMEAEVDNAAPVTTALRSVRLLGKHAWLR